MVPTAFDCEVPAAGLAMDGARLASSSESLSESFSRTLALEREAAAAAAANECYVGMFSDRSEPGYNFELLRPRTSFFTTQIGSREHLAGSAVVGVGLPMLKTRPKCGGLGMFSVCSPPGLTFELLGHAFAMYTSQIGSRKHMTGPDLVVAGLPILKDARKWRFRSVFGL